MRKLRIVFVSTYPPSAGSLNEYAYHFVRFLRRKADVQEVILLADELPAGHSYGPDAPTDSAPLTVLPSWRFGSWANAIRIAAAIRRISPHLVFFNIQFATFGDGKLAAALGLLTPALVKLLGFPTIVILHNIMETVDLENAGFASNRVKALLIRCCGTLVTRCLLASDLVALTIPKYVEILEKKYRANNVVLAPHGTFDQTPAPKFDPPDDPLRIMTFGKFGTYKRIEILIEAFQELQRTISANLELVIAGTDSPNAPGYLAALQSQYADAANIRFTGYVAEEDVAAIFHEAAVVVFPYTSTTGSSGVLHQAGSYGKAIVLPNLGDFAEIISEEGYSGEFFDPASAASLAAAIGRLLHDSERRRELGARNYLAAQGLPIDEVVDWYLLHFERMLELSGPSTKNGRQSKWYRKRERAETLQL